MLLQVYYGQDDNVNTLPFLVGCVFIYLAYKWIKSVKNNNSGRIEEPAKQSAVCSNLVSLDIKINESEASTQMRIDVLDEEELSSATSELSNKIVNREEASNLIDSNLEAAREASRVKLKGAFAGFMSAHRDDRVANTSQEDEEDIGVA